MFFQTVYVFDTSLPNFLLSFTLTVLIPYVSTRRTVQRRCTAGSRPSQGPSWLSVGLGGLLPQYVSRSCVQHNAATVWVQVIWLDLSGLRPFLYGTYDFLCDIRRYEENSVCMIDIFIVSIMSLFRSLFAGLLARACKLQKCAVYTFCRLTETACLFLQVDLWLFFFFLFLIIFQRLAQTRLGPSWTFIMC